MGSFAMSSREMARAISGGGGVVRPEYGNGCAGILSRRPRASLLRERCELGKIRGLEEGPHVLVLLFERLLPALLPVDHGEDADDLVAGFLEFLARQEGRGAGGDHVVDRDDPRPARKLVLDFPAGAPVLLLLGGRGALEQFSAALVRNHVYSP